MVIKGPYVQSKRRLAVDYSQTINRFTLLTLCVSVTLLDVYPLPRIDQTVNKIA